jgi:oligoribonuclease NrnB/cAMP/cGMP phosphodiesterase (DHH superfamily)
MMTDTTDHETWNEFVDEMNESFVQAMEQNVEAQTEFVETWFDTLEGTMQDGDAEETLEGYARAYEAWMDAAREQFDRSGDALRGEDVDAEEFRDLWLETANESFKEVMSTPAFAAVTGETIEDALELQRQADEAAQDTLHQLGFATEGDVREVGERLVELERRQHDVERKLDRVLDHLEDE